MECTFLGCCERGRLLHVSARQNLASLWREIEIYPVICSSLFPWRALRSLRLSVSLWAVTGRSHWKWCSPSGVVVNMLSGERAIGRGHMKTSYILNPQQNPGVLYNGGKSVWWGKCLETQQSCGKCYRDNRIATLFSSGYFQQSELELLMGKIRSFIKNHSFMSLRLLWK